MNLKLSSSFCCFSGTRSCRGKLCEVQLWDPEGYPCIEAPAQDWQLKILQEDLSTNIIYVYLLVQNLTTKFVLRSCGFAVGWENLLNRYYQIRPYLVVSSDMSVPMFLEYTARGYSVFFVDFGPSLFTELLRTVRRSPCDNSRRANSLCYVGPNVSSALVPRGLAGISDGSALLRGHARRTRWRSNWHLILGQDG